MNDPLLDDLTVSQLEYEMDLSERQIEEAEKYNCWLPKICVCGHILQSDDFECTECNERFVPHQRVIHEATLEHAYGLDDLRIEEALLSGVRLEDLPAEVAA